MRGLLPINQVLQRLSQPTKKEKQSNAIPYTGFAGKSQLIFSNFVLLVEFK